MTDSVNATSSTSVDLPPSLTLDWHGPVAVLQISRAAKRNALDNATVLGLEAFFADPPSAARAVVLSAEGKHFSAGLDLAELSGLGPFDSLQHSRMWHRAFERLEFGSVPVISVLKGAVIGGGLELACATHLRVAEEGAFYALPEGQHGLFVGGGGSVRIPRLIGTHRMADMMLTGRVLQAREGHDLGLSHYLTAEGSGLAKAIELATAVAANSAMTNFAVLHALPRIARGDAESGYLTESLMAAFAGSSEHAQQRMQAFLNGNGGKVRR